MLSTIFRPLMSPCCAAHALALGVARMAFEMTVVATLAPLFLTVNGLISSAPIVARSSSSAFGTKTFKAELRRSILRPANMVSPICRARPPRSPRPPSKRSEPSRQARGGVYETTQRLGDVLARWRRVPV